MTYASLEHFRDVTSRNVLALQEAREKGRKVVGQFCIYSPLEIALAADAVPVSLCGTKQDSIPVAEEVLPRCLCPLIKSSFGFALRTAAPIWQLRTSWWRMPPVMAKKRCMSCWLPTSP